MRELSAAERLGKLERFGLVLFAMTLIGFGVVVEIRGAFLRARMTDLGVFVRAAWAVRAGEDIYTVRDDKGLHYHYPPLFAILLTPLADPPAGADRAGTPPFALTVALWYLASLGFLAAAVHLLASALEQHVPTLARNPQPIGSRRWWNLRIFPVLACGPPIFNSLSLGQVTTLLLLLVCGMAAALVRRQPFQAGLWLAGAICLKVIPAFLLLYPLWRRDLRCLAGCALGLAIGLAVVPAAVLGAPRTAAYYQEWAEVLVLPAFGMGTDHSRDLELLDVTANHNQSLQSTFHNLLYPDEATRPAKASAAVRLAHWLVGGLLTLATLLASRRQRRPASDNSPDSGIDIVLLLGALVVLMLVLSPAGHSHYLGLLVLPVMGLLALAWPDGGRSGLGIPWRLLLVANFCAGLLPLLPGLHVLHHLGLAMFVALSLWLTSVAMLWREPLARTSNLVREDAAAVASPTPAY